MAPVVVLKMDVHCLRCARKIRKVIKSIYGKPRVCVDANAMRRSGSGRSSDAMDACRGGGPVGVAGDGVRGRRRERPRRVAAQVADPVVQYNSRPV